MKTLATHNGPFHTDDVMSYIILKGIYPNHTLFRTRNQEQINN